ncbi:glutamine amidotransferase [Kutzneria kofuensis]|uniref:glutamine amidotransferase n=1 Tax=Kutzneria kofuensis TaxID=103725 RepID=UPI0031E66819
MRIGLVLPDVLGTYGDSGNATVLRKRLEWRGYRAEIVDLAVGETVPNSLDFYLLGGGEGPGADAGRRAPDRQPRHAGGGLRGAVVLAICAGLQILGHDFTGTDGSLTHRGLSLLDGGPRRHRRRAVGELLTTPDPALLTATMTGFENHQGHTKVGPNAKPLSKVVYGTGGNGDGRTGRTRAAWSARTCTARCWTPATRVRGDLLLSWGGRRAAGAAGHPGDREAAGRAEAGRAGAGQPAQAAAPVLTTAVAESDRRCRRSG